VISDLLKPERTNLSIREDKKKGVFVEGLSEWVVRSPKEVYGLIRRGTALRATGATRINETSSRSHAIFIIIVEQNELIYEDDPATGAATTAGKQRAAANNAAGMTEQEKARAVAGAGNATLVRQSFKVGKLNLVDCE
jgi:kinesin family protein 3/17